jgi:hypothetical protein
MDWPMGRHFVPQLVDQGETIDDQAAVIAISLVPALDGDHFHVNRNLRG